MIENRTPESYDKLVERVLALEMFIVKNGLECPDENDCWYPKILNNIEVFYGNIYEMLVHTRSYPMGIETYKVLYDFKTAIENSGISTERLRYYQKPSFWPNCIREYISKRFAKKYQKNSQEDSYGN